MHAAARLSTLHAWQRFYNMEPRGDSALTRLYVDGRVQWSVDEVARELMSTDFIYKHTLYGELIEEYMRAMAARLRSLQPELTWSKTWELVRFYGPFTLKLYMLVMCRACIPERMPGGPPVSDDGPAELQHAPSQKREVHAQRDEHAP